MATEAMEALHAILRHLRTTIAAAESLTCGEVQTLLGSVSGSSAYFLGGVTAYMASAKIEMLGVDGRHAHEVNCVSRRVAHEMAYGVQKMFNAEIGISTTGYAEPDPSHDVEEPFAYLGFGLFEEYFEHRYKMETSMFSTPAEARIEFQKDVGYTALGILLDWFLEIRDGGPDNYELPITRLLLKNKGFWDTDLDEVFARVRDGLDKPEGC